MAPASTIRALLHRQGLIADRKKRRKPPPYSQPLQHAEAPKPPSLVCGLQRLVALPGRRTLRSGAAISPEWLKGLYFGRTVDGWMLLNEDLMKARDRTSPTLLAFGRLRGNVSQREVGIAVSVIRSNSSTIRVMPDTGLTPDISDGLARMRARRVSTTTTPM
jgi:hypothetical protein